MSTYIRSVQNVLFYRRPDFVRTPSPAGSIMDSDGVSTVRNSSVSARGIPERLSFDKILNHETCPPCTTLDFYHYLNNKVFCAETLQFYLWLRDYSHRFNSPAQSRNTSTLCVWTNEQQEEAIQKFQKNLAGNSKKAPMSPAVKEVFKGTDFSDDFRSRPRGDSGTAPPPTGYTSNSTLVGSGTVAPWESFEKSSVDAAEGLEKTPNSYPAEEGQETSQADRDATMARAGYRSAGLHYPFFYPAFRREMETIIATYIVEGGRRQLNLSAQERFAVLSALQKTPHPSAFYFINMNVESSLRGQHHPNFVLDAICNGNRPRVVFARALGAALIVLGLVCVILLSLSGYPRGYRAIAAIFWVLGISTSIAAWKGMCVVLHGMHHRHVRPWEMFQANGELGQNDALEPKSTSRNDVTTEYWVERYAKRNIVRKIFDREVWIQEPALRQIQDAVFVQAMAIAIAMSGVLTVVWVLAVPKMNMF